MLYKINTVCGIDDLFLYAPWQRLKHKKYLGDLTSLIQQIDTKSREITLESIEKFFRAGGVLVIATYRLKIVALACLVTVTSINGAIGRIENIVVHKKHLKKGLSKLIMAQMNVIAHQKKLPYHLET